MKRCFILAGLVGILVVSGGAAAALPAEMGKNLNRLQVPFMLNQGQTDRQVKFYARAFGGTAYVTWSGEIVYDLPKGAGKGGVTGWSLKEALIGAGIARVEGEEEAATGVSWFVGSDPSRWKRDIPAYGVVTMGEPYAGIHVKLRAYGASVEKLFFVVPGARPETIKVRVSGAVSLRTNDKGELEAETGLGTVVFSRPRAYQTKGGRQQEVEASYAVEGTEYGFRVGQYDKTCELVIDPVIQATYVGGTGGDVVNAAAVSGSSVYVAGGTLSTNFPGVAGGAQTANAGSSDGFVALLTSDLKTLVQATFLGGSGDERVHSVAASESGVYVAGSTNSTDFPATAGGARPNNAGVRDAFAALLTPDLKSLIQATYFGGNDDDLANSIAVAGSGAYGVLVAGSTASHDLVGTLGSAQPLNGDPQINPVGLNSYDGFVAAFTSDLKSLTQATYLGGRSSDFVNALAGTPGFIYVTGYTGSTDFPGATGGFQPVNGGGLADVFVALLTSDLTTLVNSTYMGGSGNDLGHAVAVSGSDVFVAGETNSTGFPGAIGGFQPTFAGGIADGFVARLNSGLTGLTRATYLGSGGFDRAHALAIGGSFFGNVVYVAGLTGLDPVFPPYDGFLIALTYDLTSAAVNHPYASFTFLGGSGSDQAFAMALPPSIFGFNAYVGGVTESTDFQGTTGGARATGDGADGFAAKVVLVPDYSLSPVAPLAMAPGGAGSTTVTVNSHNGLNELIKLYVFGQPDGQPLPVGLTASFLFPGDQVTPPVDGSISTTLVINAAQAVAPGSYTLWLVGLPFTSVAHATPVTVNVAATFAAVSTFVEDLGTAGCIDNSGIGSALSRALARAQDYTQQARPREAINTLNALMNMIEGQRGKHITAACTIGDMSFDAAAVLISDVQGLISNLQGM